MISNVVRIDRHDNFLELLFVILLSRQPEHISCFRDPLFLDQPPGTARNSKKQEQEEYGGYSAGAAPPSPLEGAKNPPLPPAGLEEGESEARNEGAVKKNPPPPPSHNCGGTLHD